MVILPAGSDRIHSLSIFRLFIKGACQRERKPIRQTFVQPALGIALALTLAACGGGGSQPPAAGLTVNVNGHLQIRPDHPDGQGWPVRHRHAAKQGRAGAYLRHRRAGRADRAGTGRGHRRRHVYPGHGRRVRFLLRHARPQGGRHDGHADRYAVGLGLRWARSEPTPGYGPARRLVRRSDEAVVVSSASYAVSVRWGHPVRHLLPRSAPRSRREVGS